MPRRARLGSIHDAPLSIRDLRIDDIAGGIPFGVAQHPLAATVRPPLGHRPLFPGDLLPTCIALASCRYSAHYHSFPYSHRRDTHASVPVKAERALRTTPPRTLGHSHPTRKGFLVPAQLCGATATPGRHPCYHS